MCVGPPGRRSIGPGLIFLFLFASRQKEKCPNFYSEVTTSVSSFLIVKDWLNTNLKADS